MAKRRRVGFRPSTVALAMAERARLEKNRKARERRAKKKQEETERLKRYEIAYAKREKRREEERERKARMRAMKAALLPKMRRIVQRFEEGGWENTRKAHHGHDGRKPEDQKPTAPNWYEDKIAWSMMLGESEYESVLEAISDELDLDELGWDIVY